MGVLEIISNCPSTPKMQPVLVLADDKLGKWRVSEKYLMVSQLDPRRVSSEADEGSRGLGARC